MRNMEINLALDNLKLIWIFTIRNAGNEDMEVLKNVEHIKDYGEHGFFPVFGGKM